MLAAAMVLFPLFNLQAETYFVWTNSPANGPGTSWDTAYWDIQSAINAASNNGDVVVVTNGVYATGSTAMPVPQSLNRIVATNAITVRSVNGPLVTTLDGTGGVRCAYLGSGMVLSGFTLTNGTASWTGYGGGAYAVGAVVSNCVICNCSASKYGGGAFAGEAGEPYAGGFYNCRFTDNYAFLGGGACYHLVLYNCTVVRNSCTQWGGGANSCSIFNSIVYFNTAGSGATTPNIKSGSASYTCTTPAFGGAGNITNDPGFVNRATGDYHLSSNSPCINAGGNSYAPAGTDQDGNPRIIGSLVDMGIYETPYAIIDSQPGFGCRISPSNRVPVVVSNNQTFALGTDPLLPPAIREVKVDGQSLGPTNTYTFFNVTSNHTIWASYFYTIQVASEWGTAAPLPGTYTNVGGSLLTNRVTTPDTRDSTQYVCTGWALAGHDPATGTTNVFTMAATNNAALTWQWTTNFWLILQGPRTGTVSQTTGWYAAGSDVTVTASPASCFTGWIGDTEGCVTNGATITIPMTRARSAITATFSDLTLQVNSTWGTATPPPGTWTNAFGSLLTNSVTTPDTRGDTQYVCTGWTLLWHAPSSGPTNGFTMALTNDAVLTWRWGTNYWLVMQGNGSGTLSKATGWYGSGSNVTVTANPTPGYYHTGWSGDTNDCIIAGPTLVIPVTRARATITASFGAVPAAAIYYVWTNSPVDGPGTNWDTALWDIQTAINATTNGGLVLATDGVYRVSSPVTIDATRSISLRSVNGPAFTVIDGQYTTRCVSVQNSGASVEGFTITRGQITGYLAYGAGVNLANGTISNCVIMSNLAVNAYGGGAYLASTALLRDSIVTANETTSGDRNGGGIYCDRGGTVRNCLVTGNKIGSSSDGGGVYCYYGGTVESSTIASNAATDRGGGVCCIGAGTIVNTIMFNNTSPSGPNYFSYNGGTYNYCCTTPLPGGSGNITNNPLFANVSANNYRLSPDSPCIDAGTNLAWMTGAVDLAGRPRLADAGADIGAYECRPGFIAGPLRGLPPLTVAFTSLVEVAEASNTWFTWDFDADGTNDVEGYGLAEVTNTYTNWGSYTIALTVTPPAQVTEKVKRRGLVNVDYDTVYVSTNGSHVYPFAFWSTAATNLAAAAVAAGKGRLVLVSSGVYALTETVTIGNGVSMRSVSGPATTIVDGGNAVRCFTVADAKSVLDGFTITRGHNPDAGPYSCGGGVLISAGTVQNCIIRNNWDYLRGGGVNMSGGLLQNCLIVSNACHGSIYNNDIGGGGVCLYQGGTVKNCTIVGNTAEVVGGGGLKAYYTDDAMAVQNSIIYGNTPADCEITEEILFRKLYYCCTSQSIAGEGNIMRAPSFVNSDANDYRLRGDSPCINAGKNAAAAGITDLDGNQRLLAAVVDLGAYESPYAPIDTLAGPGGSISPGGRVGVLVSSNQTLDIGFNPRLATAIVDVNVDGLSIGPTNAYTFLNVTSNHTLSAWFDRIPFTLQVESAWGTATPQPGTYTNLAASTLENTVTSPDTRGETQYVCTGWSLAGNDPLSGTTNGFTMVVTNHAALTWQWVTNYWLELQQTSGTGTLDQVSGWCGAGSNVMVTANPGWGLVNWSGDTEGCTFDGATITIPMTRARSAITAEFIQPTLQVNSDWGTATPPPGAYTNTLGASLTNSVTTPDTRGSTQYVCTGWTLAGNDPPDGTTNRFTMTATNHAALTWQWITNYWLVLRGGSSGALSQATGWYGSGTNVIVLATPAWAFTGWRGDTEGCMTNGATITIPMNRGRSAITAEFIDLTLTVSSAWGTATPPPGTWTNAYGSALRNSVTTPDTRGLTQYVCQGWSLTGNAPSNGTTNRFIMGLTNNAALTWQWTTNYWLDLQGNGSGTVNQTSGWYAANSDLTVQATPAPGYVCTGWSGDTNGCAIMGATLIVPVTRSHATITASFGRDPLGVRYYVWMNSPTNGPGTNWVTAFWDIQSAVDAAGSSNTVFVTNGVYAIGARVTPGYTLMNRVVITNNTLVTSVNGPLVTLIQGQGPTGSMRCVFISRGVLAGFTLTNGCTASGIAAYDANGAGVLALGGIVSNCVVTGNSSLYSGGGGSEGLFYNCAFIGNSANYGGGMYKGVMNHCTFSGNTATNGGGAYQSKLTNCIVYYNTASAGPNSLMSTLNYCATTPAPGGTGNITNAPAFVNTNGWSDLRLAAGSPCIDRGLTPASAAGAIDLDSNPRLVGTCVDMGAYEYPFTPSGIHESWLRRYGLSTDGAADTLDSDLDGANNWREYRAGTDPTNRSSCLRVAYVNPSATATGMVVRWDSVTGRFYTVEGSTNLLELPPFRNLTSNILGQVDYTTFTDTNAASPSFYRIRVQ